MGMKLGAMAFLVGIVLALLVGVGSATNIYTLTGLTATVVAWILIIAGAIVGLMNITNAESTPFVISVVAVTLLLGLIALPAWGEILDKIAKPIMQFLVPAAVVVGVTGMINFAKK